MRYPHDVPRLTDGVVTLRAHIEDDVEGVLEQCLDPLSVQWTTVPRGYTREDARRRVRHMVPDLWHSGAEWCFAVEAASSDGPRFAGSVSLRTEGEGRAELAYGAHPWVRGTGTMERAVRLLLGWGFAEQGLRTVVWWAHRGNWASRRLAWRLGFAIEGEVRQWLAQRGELRDAWVGTLLAADPMLPRHPWYDAPRVVGERVTLRPLGVGDVDRIVEGCTDPESRRWLSQLPFPYTPESAAQFLHDVTERHATGRAVTWALAAPDDDRLVGVLNLFDIRAGWDAEIGYWVHPAERGSGVAAAGCRLALRHAFVGVEDGGLGLTRVHACAAEQNLPSRRALEQAGLTEVGRWRRGLRVGEGELTDSVLYDVLSEEVNAHETGGDAR